MSSLTVPARSSGPTAAAQALRSPAIAIIGAGFSGTLLALHLLRRCLGSVRIHLIERSPRFGRGLAYSTGNLSHVLNVPTSRMSAFHDRPDDFLDWLRQDGNAGAASVTPDCFVARKVFGDYVRHHLKEEFRRAAGRGGRLVLTRGEVTDLRIGRGGVTLQIDRGPRAEVDIAVLAVGNFPPEPPPIADPSFYDSDRYRSDPWALDALSGLDPADPVLLIGTGLTMVDTGISLLDRGHTGKIHALSRRGLLPATPCWKHPEARRQTRYHAADGGGRSRPRRRRAVGICRRRGGRTTSEWLSRFSTAVAAIPEVMEVYRMAGDVDYMLRVAVADMAEYDAFYKRLIAAAPMKNRQFPAAAEEAR